MCLQLRDAGGKKMKRHGRGSSPCVVSPPRPAESQVEPTPKNWGHGREHGRSPGFRIFLGPTLPRLVAQWICRTLSPVTVAGAAPALHRLPWRPFHRFRRKGRVGPRSRARSNDRARPASTMAGEPRSRAVSTPLRNIADCSVLLNRGRYLLAEAPL